MYCYQVCPFEARSIELDVSSRERYVAFRIPKYNYVRAMLSGASATPRLICNVNESVTMSAMMLPCVLCTVVPTPRILDDMLKKADNKMARAVEMVDYKNDTGIVNVFWVSSSLLRS